MCVGWALSFCISCVFEVFVLRCTNKCNISPTCTTSYSRKCLKSEIVQCIGKKQHKNGTGVKYSVEYVFIHGMA